MAGRFAWEPRPELADASTLRRMMTWLGEQGEGPFGSYGDLLAWSDREPERFWELAIRFLGLRFPVPWTRIRDQGEGLAWTRWCVGARTNVVLSLLERHRGTEVETREAIRWEGEEGEVRSWTYRELDETTSRLAGALAALGTGPGDAVGIFMPMVPEVAAAFLAIQHLGAIAVPLFSGFGPEAIRARLDDADARCVVTADGTRRRGSVVPMKAVLDRALEGSGVGTVVVLESLGIETPWQSGRDHWWHEVVAGEPPRREPLLVDAETPAMLVHTSGSTGRPKGTVHTHCSYPLKMGVDFLVACDFQASDRLLWMSDFGWVVGPMQLTMSTLAGGCLVMAEGAPDYPDPGRMWGLVERHGVTYLGVAPTGVRTLMRHGEEHVRSRDLSSLRVCASTGEPWTEEAWWWFFEHVCRREAPILNVTGGTEVGGAILVGTVLHPLKPCSFGAATLGVNADVVDERGRSVPPGVVGELVLRDASPGLTRGIWKDPERYLETYWSTYGNLWRQGDWARRDEDGLWYVEGRSDDTLKIAGKRTGPAEIEGLVLATGKISEAAAVGIPDPVSGQALALVMVPAPGARPGPELEAEVSAAVTEGLGRPFRPRRQVFVSDLPKTRNMKILRRVVKAVLTGEPPGDLTALLNPEAIRELERVIGRPAGAPGGGVAHAAGPGGDRS